MPLVPLGEVHNYNCRNLLHQLIEVSHEAGAIQLFWDSSPREEVPSTRTLLWVGGKSQEERGYYCDVVTDRERLRPILIRKDVLERLAAEAEAERPIVGLPTFGKPQTEEPAPVPAPSEPELSLPEAIARVIQERGVRGKDVSCGEFDDDVWDCLGLPLKNGKPPRGYGSKTIERIVNGKKSDKVCR
jgi:hypothetical protein